MMDILEVDTKRQVAVARYNIFVLFSSFKFKGIVHQKGTFSEHLLTQAIQDVQWGKKVFSQSPIVQVLPLKKMRETCNLHHMYTSTMRDKIRKENHIVGFLKNLFANYGGK